MESRKRLSHRRKNIFFQITSNWFLKKDRFIAFKNQTDCSLFRTCFGAALICLNTLCTLTKYRTLDMHNALHILLWHTQLMWKNNVQNRMQCVAEFCNRQQSKSVIELKKILSKLDKERCEWNCLSNRIELVQIYDFVHFKQFEQSWKFEQVFRCVQIEENHSNISFQRIISPSKLLTISSVCV